MAELDEFFGVNPVVLAAALKEPKTEMSYLTEAEVSRLLSLCSGDYYLIEILLLATGAGWGEAYNLKAENIVGNRVIFTLTKNGEGRVVPVSDDIFRVIKHRESGRLFRMSYKTFRLKMKEAKPNLPNGQAAHALRHTFAAHFMMKGGNIIALQRILGHAEISQTIVYAHFAPDYLLDVVSYNPLSKMSTLCPHPGGKMGDLIVISVPKILIWLSELSGCANLISPLKGKVKS